jgi:hypothetical protein
MTVEHKILFGLDDIKAISFQCERCKYRVTMAPDEVKEFPGNCLNGHAWVSGNKNTKENLPLIFFTEYLSQLGKLQADGKLGFRILLEFDEPKS